MPRDFGLLYISPNLPKFIELHPNLHVEIEFEDKRVDLVAEGYDLALRIGYMQDSSLVARKISSSPMHFVASPSYLEARGIPLTPDDLEYHQGLLYKSSLNQSAFGNQQKPIKFNVIKFNLKWFLIMVWHC